MSSQSFPQEQSRTQESADSGYRSLPTLASPFPRGIRVTVLAAFSDQKEIALGVWQGACMDEPSAAALAMEDLWDDALKPQADANHCWPRCETESIDLLPPENSVIARYRWAWYEVNVSAQSEDGSTAHVGTWQGAANDKGDAQRRALDELWDDRLDCASCSAVCTTQKLDEAPEKFSASSPSERQRA
jgi:hypothetical protein